MQLTAFLYYWEAEALHAAQQRVPNTQHNLPWEAIYTVQHGPIGPYLRGCQDPISHV